jgi:hypothetical protein
MEFRDCTIAGIPASWEAPALCVPPGVAHPGKSLEGQSLSGTGRGKRSHALSGKNPETEHDGDRKWRFLALRHLASSLKGGPFPACEGEHGARHSRGSRIVPSEARLRPTGRGWPACQANPLHALTPGSRRIASKPAAINVLGPKKSRDTRPRATAKGHPQRWRIHTPAKDPHQEVPTTTRGQPKRAGSVCQRSRRQAHNSKRIEGAGRVPKRRAYRPSSASHAPKNAPSANAIRRITGALPPSVA